MQLQKIRKKVKKKKGSKGKLKKDGYLNYEEISKQFNENQIQKIKF